VVWEMPKTSVRCSGCGAGGEGFVEGWVRAERGVGLRRGNNTGKQVWAGEFSPGAGGSRDLAEYGAAPWPVFGLTGTCGLMC